MKSPGYFLLGVLVGGLVMAFLCRTPINAANARAKAAEIDSDLLQLYVAFVRSEHELPPCGPCETLSRAQEKRWYVPEFWGYASMSDRGEEFAILRDGDEHFTAVPTNRFISKWRGGGVEELDRAPDQPSGNRGY
jgi:hypothetical protein